MTFSFLKFRRKRKEPTRFLLIFQEQSIQPRTIHSSPAAIDVDYVVERFHSRSLALAHSQEEIEELDLRSNEEKTADDKFVNHELRSKSNLNLGNLFDMVPIVFERIDVRQVFSSKTMFFKH